MNQPAKAQEPSMEEILASIRRIIADDDAAKSPAPELPSPVTQPARPAPMPPPAAAAPPRPPATPAVPEIPPEPIRPEPIVDEPDVLDLTEAMATNDEPEAGFRTIDGQPDVVFEEPPPDPAPTFNLSRRPGLDFNSDIMSGRTSAAVDSAFNALAQTVLVQNARTLEDLVKEMLRPLLKTWLDDNLPGLVERLVRSEIERVSRGRS
jgi:cell pole-organizing protein PopZ